MRGTLSARRRQQVNVIGHQHIGVDRAAIAICHVDEPIAVARVAVGAKEYRLAVVATLDHMQRLIGQKPIFFASFLL